MVDMVRLEEKGDLLVVSGPYNDMVKVIPRLKSLGFRYDSFDRTWSAPKSSLTTRKLENLKALINGEGPKPVTKNLDEAKEALQKASKLQFVGFVVELSSSGSLLLAGDTYELRAECRDAGGDWSASEQAWVFAPDSVDVRKFEKLIDRVDRISKANAIRVGKIEEFLSKPKTWPNLGVILAYEDRAVVVRGNTRELRDEIRRYLPEAKFQAYWSVPRLKVNPDDLVRLSDKFDALEAEKATKPEEKSAPLRQVNRRGGECQKCGLFVPPGDGYLVSRFDGDDDKWIYLVEHKDPKICEERLAELKIREERARNKQEALKNLRRMAQQPTYYSEGNFPMPQGEKIELRPAGYGGGTYVVIEPDGSHFWLIEGNSADGDDWSRNNIGGHSMGWRVPMTDEARVLIEVASGRSS